MRLADLDLIDPQEKKERLAVLSELKTWIGTPYHHLARVKGAGVDCVQLLIGAYQGAGLIGKVETGEYSRTWHLHQNEEKYLERLMPWAKPTDNPLPADIALFTFGRTVSHAGILVDYPVMIHSYFDSGVRIEEITSGRLGKRFYGYYSFWGK